MTMVFPLSPAVGQVFSSGGRSWVWNGSTWDAPSATNVLQVPIGLEFIKAQTIGTAVSSVAVNDVFSSRYDAYKIFVSGGANSTVGNYLRLLLGSSTVANYNWNLTYNTWGASGVLTLSGVNQGAWQYAGTSDTSGLCLDVTLVNPFEAKNTHGVSYYSDVAVGGTALMRHTANTSFTGFTVITSGGTMTGGTIAVYGYRKVA